MSKVALRTSAVVAFALLLPAAAAAQPTVGDVRRPYRALFGGDPNDTTASSLSVSFEGGYEDNVPAGNAQPMDPRFTTSTLTGGVMANLTLQRSGDRAAFGVSVSSALRYVETDQELTSLGHGASAFARTHLGQRASVDVVGAFMWAPLYNPLLSGAGFGGDGLEPFTPNRLGSDYSAGARPAIFANAGVNMSYAVTRRATLTGGYRLHFEDYTDEDREQRAGSIRAGASYRLTRYSSLRLDYSHVQHELENGTTSGDIHDFGGGIDYRRPLSLSGRRTTFTVTPGMALDRRSGETRMQVTGSATLAHELGRTWTLRASYRRGFRFTDGLDAEMLANTGTAYVEGLLNRRVALTFGGQVVISGDKKQEEARDYLAYSLSGRISYALTRNISTYAQYIYYSYQFGSSVVLPPSVVRELDRQGIRVGLSFWVPVLR